MHYAYLHGFASSPLSTKGQRFAQQFAEVGEMLYLPDLNRPDFAHLTVTGALDAVDDLVATQGEEEVPWSFIGSSMGGWVAALWAARHPDRVARLALLCPGFGLQERWPEMLGAEQMRAWEETGWMTYPDGAGTPTQVHWGFIEDAATHQAAPRVEVPTRVFHGEHDQTVPVESSRAWVGAHAEIASLTIYDDDHRLLGHADEIAEEIMAFFGVGS